jgi:hypothetical protein
VITVVGTWDLAWNTPIKEADLWSFALREYDVDSWWMSPVSGIASGISFLGEDPQMEPRLRSEIEQGRTLVYVDESGDVDLADFAHPNDACYVLGKPTFSPWRAFSRSMAGNSVRIATPRDLGGFWPSQAIAIVLHDRFSKERTR